MRPPPSRSPPPTGRRRRRRPDQEPTRRRPRASRGANRPSARRMTTDSGGRQRSASDTGCGDGSGEIAGVCIPLSGLPSSYCEKRLGPATSCARSPARSLSRTPSAPDPRHQARTPGSSSHDLPGGAHGSHRPRLSRPALSNVMGDLVAKEIDVRDLCLFVVGLLRVRSGRRGSPVFSGRNEARRGAASAAWGSGKRRGVPGTRLRRQRGRAETQKRDRSGETRECPHDTPFEKSPADVRSPGTGR